MDSKQTGHWMEELEGGTVEQEGQVMLLVFFGDEFLGVCLMALAMIVSENEKLTQAACVRHA